MNSYFKYILPLFITLNLCFTYAQSDFILKDDVSDKIKFDFASNLIIIPLEINGVTLSFVLDSSVSKPILFNLSQGDSLDLRNTETFYLHGLGADGRLKALKSSYNRIKVGDAVSTNKDVYVVFDSSINFTPRLGIFIHGIIGYDIFKDFVVEINYNSKYLRLHKSESYKPKSSKRWKSLPLNIYKKKPYVNAKVKIKNSETDVKLLIDTRSSDALWLFEDLENGITPIKELFFDDYLGKGLSGSVYGKRSKVKSFQLSDFILNDVNVAFPDSSTINRAKLYKDRSGSLGGGILKRFNFFFRL